jgi:hypothetical protein
MSLPETGRASRVCSTCKSRKKGCNKILPSCGYCSKRQLDCHYTTSLPSLSINTGARYSITGQLPTLERSALSHASALETVSPSPAISLYDFVRIKKEIPLNDSIRNEVLRVAESAGMSVRGICEQFFDGFHRWLPVISQERFWKTSLAFHDGSAQADFSVLLLAMCLIAIRPVSLLQQSSTCLDSLYSTVRFSFAKAQAAVCTSTRLIQAGILLATYEYACKKPEAAYISIGTCARMSSILGINRFIAQSETELTAELRLKVLEGRNVWWGVIITERRVLKR